MFRLADSRMPIVTCALVCVASVVGSRAAEAYTPESPEVQKLIQEGLGYLEKTTDDRLGGKCLIGMAFAKEDYPPTHPRIVEAVEMCRQVCQEDPRKIFNEEPGGIYSIGLALIFLSDLNAERHRKEIDKLIETLLYAQRPYGGWGYPIGQDHDNTADTSMTQYGVLGLWTADRAGVRIPADSLQRVTMWLIRTQDPSGAWGYQGIDPGGSGANRVPQSGVRLSMAAAGLGSMYVCADLLGLSQKVAKASATVDDKPLPAALIPVGDDNRPRRAAPAAGGMASLIKRATDDGNAWFAENFEIDADSWDCYYLYSLERYKSFQELLEKTSDPEPDWYNQGVELLGKRQTPKGTFGNHGSGGRETVDTAFSILFLMRSTQKSIKKAVNYGDGRLTGGRGLPKNLANASVKRGKVVGKPLGGSADDLLALLEDPDNPDFDSLTDNPESILLSAKQGSDDRELERLRRIIQGGNFEARKLAVQALSVRRNLDNVPVLIYALTDPDVRVAIEARDALRFISRRFDGFGMSDEPTLEEKISAAEAWKSWFLSIRPDAEFLN